MMKSVKHTENNPNNVANLNNDLLSNWIDFLSAITEQNPGPETRQLKTELCKILRQPVSLRDNNKLIDAFIEYIDSPTPQEMIFEAMKQKTLDATSGLTINKTQSSTSGKFYSLYQTGFSYFDESNILNVNLKFHSTCRDAFKSYWIEANRFLHKSAGEFEQRLQILRDMLSQKLAKAKDESNLALAVYTHQDLQADRTLIKTLLSTLEEDRDPDIIYKTDKEFPETHRTLSERLDQINWLMALHFKTEDDGKIGYHQLAIVKNASGELTQTLIPVDFDSTEMLQRIAAYSKILRNYALTQVVNKNKRLKMTPTLHSFSRHQAAPRNETTFLGMKINLNEIPTLTVNGKKIHVYLNAVTIIESDVSLSRFLGERLNFEHFGENKMAIPFTIAGEERNLPLQGIVRNMETGHCIYFTKLTCDQNNDYLVHQDDGPELYIGFIGKKHGEQLYFREKYDLIPPIQPKTAEDVPLPIHISEAISTIDSLIDSTLKHVENRSAAEYATATRELIPLIEFASEEQINQLSTIFDIKNPSVTNSNNNKNLIHEVNYILKFFQNRAGKPSVKIPVIPYESICQRAELGDGGVGNVFEGIYGGRTIALKKFKTQTNDFGKRDEKYLSEFVQNFEVECNAMAVLSSPNIIKLIGICISPWCIVMEHAKGSLSKHLEDQSNPIEWHRKLKIAAELASAIGYLHSKNYLHCDLKSDNVLLTETQGVRLADFSNVEKPPIAARDAACTIGWRPPEFQDRSALWLTSSDMFSYGVILWEMVKSMSLDQSCQQQIIYNGNGLTFPESTDKPYLNFAKKLMSKIPGERPSATEAELEMNKQHSSLKGLNSLGHK
jgi:hypothetical protein